MPDPTNLTYKELCANYDLIINEPIDLAPPKDRTIFDISEYRHYEEVISNWYAFFFDTAAEHSLRDLFLQSLVEIINKDKDHREFSMENCRVEREFRTKKGRIDLVIYEQSKERENFETAIIIENKIHAGLHNDLDGYYESVRVVEPDQKVGIVLSLNEIKQEALPEEFINITHKELLEAIKRNLGKCVVSAKLKYILYLQDFISNLEQMTGPKKMHESIKYYFEKAGKMQDLLTLRSHAYQHIIDDLCRVIQADQGWEWRRKNPTYVAFSKVETEIWYNLEHSEVFETKKFRLKMYLKGEETIQAWKTKGGQNKIYSKYKSRFTVENHIADKDDWTLLAEKDHEVKNIEGLEYFGETVLNILTEDWAELLEYVTELLRPAS